MKIATLTVVAIISAVVLVSAASASVSEDVLRVTPSTVRFGTKPVGSFTLKGAWVTNVSFNTVNVLVTILFEPDDFSFGLLPGSTCPVFEPAPLAAGASCDAVMGFRPSEFFAGQPQVATLLATATDPTSGVVLETESIDFTGRGK